MLVGPLTKPGAGVDQTADGEAGTGVGQTADREPGTDEMLAKSLRGHETLEVGEMGHWAEGPTRRWVT